MGGGLKAGGEERMRGQTEMEKGSTAVLGWLRLFDVVLGGPGMVGAEAGGDAECCDEKEEGRRAKGEERCRRVAPPHSTFESEPTLLFGDELAWRRSPRMRRCRKIETRPSEVAAAQRPVASKNCGKGGCGRSEEAPDARDLDWRNAGQTGAPRSVGCVCLEARERL